METIESEKMAVLREKISHARDHARELQGRFGETNVGEMERWASIAGGTALAAAGIRKGGLSGIALGILGASLLQRGATGHCQFYHALGVNTSDESGPHTSGAALNGHEGIKVEKAVTIMASREQLYRFWRSFDNLPKIMKHLESVSVLDERRSHWVAKAPAGKTVEWDAEIINEHENELIAWKSLEGSEIDNAGSVRFERAPGDRGTVVRVSLIYKPPAGKMGAFVAKLFGEEPNMQVQEDLRRFKQLMEAGEIPTIKGQSSGRGIDD